MGSLPLTDPPRENKLPAYIRWALLALACLSVLVVSAALILDFHGRKQLREALERIRAAGAPLTPEELIRGPAGEGKDPTQWVVELESDSRGWELYELEHEIGDLTRRAAAGELGPVDVAAFERVRACYAEESGTDFWEGLWRLAETPGGGAELEACQRETLQLLLLGQAALVEHLGSARDFRAFDPRDVLARAVAEESLLPESAPGFKLITAAGFLHDGAIAAALLGEADSAVQRVALAFELERIAGEPLWVVDFLGWIVLRSYALEAMRQVVLHIPKGIDSGGLRARIANVEEPLARLHRALEGERVLGIRLIEMFDDQVLAEAGPARSLRDRIGRWLYRFVRDRDRALYLSEFEEAFLHLERTGVARVPPDPRERDVLLWAPLTALITPDLSKTIEQTLVLEAEQRLAMVTLVAYAEGIEAAMHAIASAPDPFSEQHLRSRVDGSLLILWSVGPDGADDGATRADARPWYGPTSYEQGTDIVWRIRCP